MIYNIIKWEDFKYLVKQYFNINFVKTDDFFHEGTEWFSLENYEETDDLEIINCLEGLRNIEGELIVVTDASYKKELGPFRVNAARIREFVREHYNNFGEHFLETDVIIINMEKKVVWIFHHEGVYALVHF